MKYLLLILMLLTTSVFAQINIGFDVDSVTMQQNTDMFVYLNFSSDSDIEFQTTTYVQDFEYVKAQIYPHNLVYKNSKQKVKISTFGAQISSYPIKFITNITFKDGTKEQRINYLWVDVINKQKYSFQTSKNSNDYPKLDIIEIENRNIVLEKGKDELIVINVINTSSTSRFEIKAYTNEDINIIPLKQNFELMQGVNTKIYAKIHASENIKDKYINVDLLLRDISTDLEYYIGNLNVYIVSPQIIYSEKFENNKRIVTVENIGDAVGIATITDNDKIITIEIEPNSQRIVELDQIIENAKDKGLFAGFFTLTDTNNKIILFTLLIIVSYIIYRILFGKTGLFSNSISASELKL